MKAIIFLLLGLYSCSEGFCILLLAETQTSTPRFQLSLENQIKIPLATSISPTETITNSKISVELLCEFARFNDTISTGVVFTCPIRKEKVVLVFVDQGESHEFAFKFDKYVLDENDRQFISEKMFYKFDKGKELPFMYFNEDECEVFVNWNSILATWLFASLMIFLV